MLTADILEGWIGPERRLPASLARNYLLSTAIPASPEFPQCRLNQFILHAPGFSPHQQPQYPYPARTNRATYLQQATPSTHGRSQFSSSSVISISSASPSMSNVSTVVPCSSSTQATLRPILPLTAKNTRPVLQPFSARQRLIGICTGCN